MQGSRYEGGGCVGSGLVGKSRKISGHLKVLIPGLT